MGYDGTRSLLDECEGKGPLALLNLLSPVKSNPLPLTFRQDFLETIAPLPVLLLR